MSAETQSRRYVHAAKERCRKSRNKNDWLENFLHYKGTFRKELKRVRKKKL